MTNYEQKAKELIESFYSCMPFKDVKLTSCGENPELIVKMEKLSAKQCAIIAVDEILANIDATIFYHKESIALPFNKEYWLEVRSALNGL
jgi:hypothetical protein